MARPRVRVPKKPIKQGEAFEIKTLLPHRMESGHRKDRKTGLNIPRLIVNKFVCRYNGEEVFRVDLRPAISSNPYIAFYAVATASGEMEFIWEDDAGKVYKKTVRIEVI